MYQTTVPRERWLLAAMVTACPVLVSGCNVATLSERDHSVTVNIDYGAQGIFIDYVDSTELMYQRDSSGQETIHRKYNTWVKNLADDIRLQLVQARAS